MDQIGLLTAAFLSVMLFLVLLLQYELDLTPLVATLLAVSVMSVGLLVAIGLEMLVGLSVVQTVLGLGVLLFVIAVTYELVS